MKVYTINAGDSCTAEVLDCMVSELSCLKKLDFTGENENYDLYRFSRGDLCFVGIAAENGRVSEKALFALKSVRAAQAGIVYVVTAPNGDPGDAVLELRMELEKCGFASVAAVSAVKDQINADELKKIAEKIKEKAVYPLTWGDFFVPGRFPFHTEEEFKSAKGNGRKSFLSALFGGKREEPEKRDTMLYL